MALVFKVLKALYSTFGEKHPQGSLSLVMVLGAIVGALAFGAVWVVARTSYEKDSAGTPSTHVEVLGNCSSGSSGNGNSTNISCDTPKQLPKK
jgi:hypothetical protein